ncbi:threonine-phosphate decarboxylase [Anaerocolumna cellulosilytica]|uniref:Threonine-phosphate decarboxylase n=1 Tax=Anaerocolumna cellulosilytica TaxID=433286 RepID=A0A6S6RBY7_9FIRM|nr:histidinol-phosphate transaminase [Anaerocolumna cellulosilytica]MBB5196360.1 threonine-phosphate decarboxylase [Anaerocolumna cellulosilytica]BCJ96388.1 threonine-phosphate decarboxylase [Anaerocolumna cellulosilytica]
MHSYEHGGETYDKEITLDFSANINPFGLPEGVKDALLKGIDSFNVYPDQHCRKLRTDLAKKIGIEDKSLIIGNGASDIIFRICFAVKPKKALLLAPTFSEYEKALKAAGCDIDYYALKAEDNYCLTEQFINALTADFDIVFLCNPNNPVGNILEKRLVKKIQKVCKEKKIFLVMDECFLDFTNQCIEASLLSYIKGNENLLILKAFTKFYAMAGLRLGYGICSNRELIKAMEYAGPSWNVSIPAQIAGIAALKEDAYDKATYEWLLNERDYLYEGLLRLEFKVYKPEANYIFFKGAENLYEDMLEKGILLRQCANYRGLSGEYYRIAVKTRKENEQLLKAIKEWRAYA